MMPQQESCIITSNISSTGEKMDKGSGKMPPRRSLMPGLLTRFERGPNLEMAERLEQKAASPQPTDPPYIAFEKKLPELWEAR